MDLAFTSPESAAAVPAAQGRAGDRYLLVLSACLLGYALMGRPFAYLGVPPLFVGEAMLAAGLLLTVRLRGLDLLGREGPFWVLAALLLLTLVRSVPYIGLYGLDVARDAMLIGYGLYAVVAYLLLVERPERLRTLVVRYRTFAVVMVALVWLPYLLFRIDQTWIPLMPGQDTVRIVEAKGGDLMVHLSAIGAFLLLGLRRPSWPVTLALAANAVLVMVSNRGGMIAFVLTLGLAFLLRPPGASGLRLAFALAAVVVAGVVAVPVMQAVRISGDSRALTVEQIWDNARSIVGQSDSASLETTKTWRLRWWRKIADDVLFGDKVWTGRGFGVNFADLDGFAIDDAGSLRSPHNAAMTVLGRLGMPGLALWVLLHAWWVFAMARAWFAARAARLHTWSAVFAFGLCLWLAMCVNASFEVYFEGPMGGIWLWTVVGAGLAATQIVRRHPDLFSTPAFGTVSPVRRAPVTTWTPPPHPDAPRPTPAAPYLAPPPARLPARPPAALPWTAPPWMSALRLAKPWSAGSDAAPVVARPSTAPPPVATSPAPPAGSPLTPPQAAPPRPPPPTQRPPAPLREEAPADGLRPTDAVWEWSPTATAWRAD